MSPLEVVRAGGAKEAPCVVFGFPTYAPISPAAHFSHMGAVVTAIAAGLSPGYVTQDHTLIEYARTLIVKQALELPKRPSHILWVDSDVTVPKNVVELLLRHNMEVAGGVYRHRNPPHQALAYDFDTDVEGTIRGTTPVAHRPGRLVRCDGLGFGCTLTRLDLFEKMTAHFGDHRYFSTSVGTEDSYSEDVWFFKRCREMGVDAWLDGDVLCGHVSEVIVNADG